MRTRSKWSSVGPRSVGLDPGNECECAPSPKIQGGKKEPQKMTDTSVFDAGDSYLSWPKWVPCRSLAARAMGVVVGRWVGG